MGLVDFGIPEREGSIMKRVKEGTFLFNRQSRR